MVDMSFVMSEFCMFFLYIDPVLKVNGKHLLVHREK